VFATTQKLQVNAHLDAVRTAHADLDTIKPQIQDWIQTQPKFLQAEYARVAKSGSSAEVIELVDQFKESKGTAGAVPELPASSARAAPPAVKPAAKKPSAAARKALSATPSPSKADVPGSASPDDFDAAFEEAAGLG